MMNPMNHMTTHFPGYGDMGGQHTGPGPGSPAQQQQQQQQQQMGPGPVDGMNGFRGMQQQQPGPGMFQPGPPGPMEPQQQQQQQQQQQRSMMGSNAHMAGGQVVNVVTNNLMNGSSMSLGPGSGGGGGGGGPMNGGMPPMNMMQQQQPPQQQPPQQQQPVPGVMQQQQQQMMGSNPHMGGVHNMDGSGIGVGIGNGGGVGGGGGVRACAGCGGKILERFLFHALDRFWHHGCLKCSCCGARLADIGVSCYTKAGMILCRADYVRLFGSSGACSACGQGIPANELVMRVGGAGPTGPAAGAQTPANAAGAVYHVKCFACTKCQTQLMPGDRYALIGGSLLCEQDCHKIMKNNNNNNNVNTNNNNHANQAGGVGASSVLPPGGAAAVGNATGGGGGGPLKKGKVGRPRRSRD